MHGHSYSRGWIPFIKTLSPDLDLHFIRLQLPSSALHGVLTLLHTLAALPIAIMIRTPYLNWYGRGFKLRAAITIACQMAFVLFGYDQGVFSGIVGNADFLNTFNHPSPALEGIIVSIYNLGCFTGCILTFLLAEKTGRKLAMWIAMVWIIVSICICATWNALY